jgi:ketopantoate reductase
VWRDLAVHHRPTEVDCILSPVTAFAARRGRTLVRLERLIGLIREVEDGARALDWGNLDDLLGRHERAEADEAA